MEEIINQLIQLNLEVVRLAGEGNLSQAMMIAQQAVNIGISQQCTDNSAYCDSLNNLAELYRIQGRYSQAKPLYLQVLDIRKNLFGVEHPDVAQSLNNLAALYYAQGNYTTAEKLFLEALELWKICYGEEDFEIAPTLNNLAEIYREQGLYFKAEQVHLEALSMRKSLFGDEHPDIAQSLTNLANIYILIGRYADAEKMQLETLAMKKQLLGDRHPDIAASLNNLGKLYDAQGRYLEAESKFWEALEISQEIFGDAHPDIANILSNIGGVYQDKGNYVAAEEKFLEVLAMNRHLLGNEHPDIAHSLDNLAEVYLIQGKYVAAENKYLEAYNLRKRLLTAEHPDMAESLSNLGLIYTYQGRYIEAERQYLQALPILEKFRGTTHLSIANILTNMAGLYEEQGNYSEAEQKYLQALEIQRNSLTNEHPVIADTLHQIAALYRIQGRYSESEQVSIQSLGMRKRLLGERHPLIAASLNNLAVLYDDLTQYEQSESLLLAALEIVKDVFGNEHPHVASSMNNLAVIYDFQGRYQEAETLHLETLKLRKLLLGEEHIQIATSLNNLGELYFSLGRYQEAEQKYLETLAMRKRLLGDEHPDVAFSLNNLATLLAATHRPESALAYRVQASKINNKMIRNIFAFSSESDRLSFLQKIRRDFDLFLCLVYTYLSHSENAKLAAFDFILQRKALTASALAAQNAALHSGRYPQLQAQLRQLSDLNSQIIHLTFAEELTNYRENLARLQAQYNYLQKQLALQVPEIQLSELNFDRQAIEQSPHYAMSDDKPLLYETLRERAYALALPLNSILLEFVRFDVFDFQAIPAQGQTQWYPPRYLVFIFKAGQADKVDMVDLGTAATIDQLIQEFRLQASDYTQMTLGWSKNSQTPTLHIKSYHPQAAIQLSQALFAPIRDLVKDCRHLIIASDSSLNLVPFQILPVDSTSSRLLMDEYTISYLSVGREILRPQLQSSRNSISAPLIIADPDFDLKADLVSQEELTSTNAPLEQISELLNTLTATRLLRAPGTKFLGESVAKKLPNAQLHLGADALETHLTNGKCPSIMLIATHGLFLPNSESKPVANKPNLLSMERLRTTKVKNPMMRSGLALAGANTWLSGGNIPKDAGKGFVFAQDIANLNLWGNELTVLSACDTARGDIQIGEGVFGLRRAFAVAGTKTLVMSLWPVSDKVTALLMERFFDNLHSSIGCVEALQEAQNYIRNMTVQELRQSALGLEVLKTLLDVEELFTESKINCPENDTPLKHPFYWGAWICQGENNILEEKLKG
ncbi:CHAT domain-containing protein [Nostoc sp. TCL26-01]|uniref:CHAT domain-containing tetratricopeptide repeat protein n=1 Tax=Nostoc sp. TCL26-01 TaxID=2576904 RepID=UPI0015BEA20E|nr:CHAT domain-containing protein [Nostoc sp. TCL26-01]QLE57421.1 tetratricopeptide repeat protein [Nostoc sp. TCL26-01]